MSWTVGGGVRDDSGDGAYRCGGYHKREHRPRVPLCTRPAACNRMASAWSLVVRSRCGVVMLMLHHLDPTGVRRVVLDHARDAARSWCGHLLAALVRP